MPTNTSAGFQADIVAWIAKKTLPLARRQLVVYQFGDPLTLPKGHGVTYTATRYNRIPLPFAPLSEGVPPVGQLMTIAQVTATLLQWGDKVTITDVAELTIYHPLFKKATELTGLQVAETLERNTFNNLMGGTQVNYVNTRGSRFALAAGDVMNIHELNRAYAMMVNIGAPRYMGDEMTDTKLDASAGGAKASSNPRSMPHYVMVCHPFVISDLRENQPIQYAWSHSDINRLYNFEAGEWSGIRFCWSNMVPSFTGVALVTGTAGTAGSLAGAPTNYFVLVTASDVQNQYESQIYQVSGAISVTGPNGSISVTLPTLAGFTFNVYVGLTTSPTNLGTTVAGPTSGPMAGQATQLAGGQTVIITNLGVVQVPPAPVATGLTVYPNFIFGRGAYGQIVLSDVEFSYLDKADKSDVLNQLRVVGWKAFYGTIIQNNNFFMRIESVSSFTSAFG